MKQKFKNLLKLGFLTFGVSLIVTNCQKDDLENNTQKNIEEKENKFSVTVLRTKEVQHNKNVMRIINKAEKKVSENKANKTVYNADYGFTINTNYAKVIETNGLKNYTFGVYRKEANGLLENLLLEEQADSTFKVSLVQYNITESEKNSLINREIINAEDKITFIALDDISDTIFGKLNSDAETCTVYSNQYQDGESCYSGRHSYSDGASCWYWQQGFTIFMATSGGYVLTAGEQDCGSGGGGATQESSGPSGSPSGGYGGGDGTYVPPTTTPVLCPECPEIDEDGCFQGFTCRSGEFLDENCECQIDLLDPCANRDLINYQVSTEVLSTLESRQQPNSMVQSSEIVDSFILETVDDGWGDINQDRFSIKIDQLPNGNTPFQLFNDIRMNLANLVVGGDIPYITDVNLEPYAVEDGVTWNSNNPVGAAMDFDTMIDTSTVYCVEYNAEEMYWVFATVTSYDHQGHFVAGIRQFGLEPNGSGGYSFYVRAADRLGGVLDYIGNGLSFSEEVLFTQAGDPTWKNLMENVSSFIQNNGGNVNEFDEGETYGTRHPYNEGDCPDEN